MGKHLWPSGCRSGALAVGASLVIMYHGMDVSAADETQCPCEIAASPGGDAFAAMCAFGLLGYQNQVYLSQKNDTRWPLLYSEERGLRAAWSPNGGFLALTNEWDTHASRVLLFRIGVVDDLLSGSLVWSSPGEEGVRYSIDSWHSDNAFSLLREPDDGEATSSAIWLEPKDAVK